MIFESVSVMTLHPLVLLGHNTIVSQIGRALIVSLQSCPGDSTVLVGSCTLSCVAAALHPIVPLPRKGSCPTSYPWFWTKGSRCMG
jgi:hypothetical protein